MDIRLIVFRADTVLTVKVMKERHPLRPPSVLRLLIQGSWRHLPNCWRWRRATTPMLLHSDTFELLNLMTTPVLQPGEWWLRRPLALEDSATPVYLMSHVVVSRPFCVPPFRAVLTTQNVNGTQNENPDETTSITVPMQATLS